MFFLQKYIMYQIYKGRFLKSVYQSRCRKITAGTYRTIPHGPRSIIEKLQTAEQRDYFCKIHSRQASSGWRKQSNNCIGLVYFYCSSHAFFTHLRQVRAAMIPRLKWISKRFLKSSFPYPKRAILLEKEITCFYWQKIKIEITKQQ